MTVLLCLNHRVSVWLGDHVLYGSQIPHERYDIWKPNWKSIFERCDLPIDDIRLFLEHHDTDEDGCYLAVSGHGEGAYPPLMMTDEDYLWIHIKNGKERRHRHYTPEIEARYSLKEGNL